MPVLCVIFGVSSESNALNALLQCESRSVHAAAGIIFNPSKAAHSSSQRSFNDWQHSSSQLPIRIKSPMHPPPASGSFLFSATIGDLRCRTIALRLCNAFAN